MSHAKSKATTIGELGEFGVIDRIHRVLGDGHGVVLGIGDDAAAIRPTRGKLLLATCDIQIEERHFVKAHMSPEQLGRRSAAVNLSDIAAMGGQPTNALVSLSLPNHTEARWVEQFYMGLRQAFGSHGASIVGGNLSGGYPGIVIDITLHGEVDERSMLRRSGATVGDAILVTGQLGSSAIGRQALRAGLPAAGAAGEPIRTHLEPKARVKEGQVIANSRLANAMIDLSDGLLADLGHMCKASGVGARVFLSQLPISRATRQVAADLSIKPVEAALHGGEDYELILACKGTSADRLIESVQRETGTPLTVFGEIIEESGLRLVEPDGTEHPSLPTGWDHFMEHIS